jgi:two-component system KDP operon response regulator KdpE
MIVDDEPDMVVMLTMEIELGGGDDLVVVATAASGAEALRTFADARPDVMVIDYMMPDSNGLEVAAKVLTANPTQSIILFSAFLTDQTISMAREVGIRECVSKSRMKDLPNVLRKYAPT